MHTINVVHLHVRCFYNLIIICAMSLIIDVHVINPGDIILTKGTDTTSKWISDKQDGYQYTHAMFYLGGSTIVHATRDMGVATDNICRYLFEEPDEVKIFRLNDHQNQGDSILRAIFYARLVVSMPYGDREALCSIYKDNIRENRTNQQFCSRLITRSYQFGGIKLVEDVEYPTVKDIGESQMLMCVDNFLKVATEEEENYACSPSILDKQAIVTRDFFENIREVVGFNEVYDLDQLIECLIEHPDKDAKLLEIMCKSGYLELWKDEEKQDYWLYDPDEFKRHYGKDALDYASEILNYDDGKNLYVYMQNALLYIKREYIPNSIFVVFLITLYDQLIKQWDRRQDVARSIMQSHYDSFSITEYDGEELPF